MNWSRFPNGMLTTWLMFLCFGLKAQPEIWRKAVSDQRIDVLDRMSYADTLLLHYRKSNPDSASYFAHVVLHLAVLAQDTGSVDYATMHLGSLHRIRGNFDSSVYYYNRALISYKEKNFEEGIASVYNNLATVYKTQSRYDLAIKNYHEALEIFRTSDNANARANLYSSFAGLYFRLENYIKAFNYWKKAEVDFLQAGNRTEITHCWRGFARLAMEQRDFVKASQFLKEALDLDQMNDIGVFVVEDYLLLMELYNATNDSRQFEQISHAIQPLRNEIDNPLNKAIYFEQEGIHAMQLDRFEMASSFFDSCVAIASVEEFPEIRLRVLKKKLLADLYNDGNVNQVAQLKGIEELEALVAGIRKDRITQEMNASYELKDKEEKIQLLRDKNQASEQIVAQERELNARNQQQLVLLWIGIGLFCILLAVIILANRRLKHARDRLKKSAEEKEFLFKELNHRVKNNLHIVSSFLGIEMHGKSEEIKAILSVFDNRIHSLGLMHELLYQGDITDTISLDTYLQKLVKFLSQTIVDDATDIRLYCPPGIVVSSQRVVLVGLIVNELVTNALKYARETSRKLEIQVNVHAKDDFLSVSVTDNGVGLTEDFDPLRTNSLGMKMAFGLTRQLGGTFSYQRVNPGSSFIFSLRNIS